MADLWLGLFLSALAFLAWCGVRLRRLARDRELAVRAGAAAVADRVAMRQQTVEAQARAGYDIATEIAAALRGETLRWKVA